MNQEIRPVKITSLKDNLELRISKLNVIVGLGKLHFNANYLVSIEDKSDRAKPRFKMFLDNHGVACPLVLKKLEDKSYITTILELEKTYGSFIKRAGEIYGCEKISAYKINPAMEEIECLN